VLRRVGFAGWLDDVVSAALNFRPSYVVSNGYEILHGRRPVMLPISQLQQ